MLLKSNYTYNVNFNKNLLYKNYMRISILIIYFLKDFNYLINILLNYIKNYYTIKYHNLSTKKSELKFYNNDNTINFQLKVILEVHQIIMVDIF